MHARKKKVAKRLKKTAAKQLKKTTTKRPLKKTPDGLIIGNLPDKSSALIRLALKELRRVEKNRLYEIDMCNWHSSNGKCSVCLAGSVISNYVNSKTDCIPDAFDEETMNKLYALDYVRKGDLEMFYSIREMERPIELNNCVYIPAYEAGNRFYEALEKIAKLCAVLGD